MVPGVTDCEAWPALRGQLVMIGLDGADPYAALQRAQIRQDLDGSNDPAAVLAWRLQPEQRHDSVTVPALPVVPRSLEADDYWHQYFDRRHELIDRHAGDLRVQVAQWTPTTAPTWAGQLIDRDRDLTADLAVWRAGHNVPDTDLRSSGTRRHDYAGWQAQRSLDRRVETVLGSADSTTTRWQTWADTIDARITTDPTWPQTAAALDAAEHTGVTRPALARLARQQPLPDEQPAAALRWRITAATADSTPRQQSPRSDAQARQQPPYTTEAISSPPPTVDYSRAFGNRPPTGPNRGR